MGKLKLQKHNINFKLASIGFVILLYVLFGMIFVEREKARAQVADTINFQGRIVNKVDGTNIRNGSPSCVQSGADTCDFQVRIYDTASVGTLLFEESHYNIEIGDTNGMFTLFINGSCGDWLSTCLGAGVDWTDGGDKYIEIEFDSDGDDDFAENEIFERVLMTAVPYSYQSDFSGKLGGLDSSEYVHFAATTAQTTGNVTTPLIHINNTGSGSENFMEFEVGGTDRFIVSGDGSIGIGNTPTAFLDVMASTTSKAQINFTSGTDPTSPVTGDLWFDGTDLKFYDGSTTTSLGGSGGGGSWTESGGLVYLTTTTNDFAIGGNGLFNSMFSIDESTGTFRFNPSGGVNPAFNFEATDGDQGIFAIDDTDVGGGSTATLYFSGANVGIGLVNATQALDVSGNIQLTGNLLPAAAPTYTTTTMVSTIVDSTGDVGNTPSIAIGTDGLPIIGYYDATNTDVKIVKCGNASCTSGNTITPIDTATNVFAFNSIAIGTDGLPVMAYFDTGNGNLKVVKCGNAACSSGNTISTADNSANVVGNTLSLAIGSDGLPVIAHYDSTALDLKITKCGNAACSSGNTSTSVVTTNDSGAYPSIAIGADGLPIVSYQYNTGLDLQVLKCGNLDCTAGNTTTSVDSTNSAGYFSTIKVPADGLPVISHYENTSTDLRVVKCGNVACSSGNTLTTVESSANIVGYTAELVIGQDGLPVIVHHDETAGDLKFVKCGNAACSSGNTSTTVLSTNDVGVWPVVAIGTDGFPILAYYDQTGLDLGVTKCANQACTKDSLSENLIAYYKLEESSGTRVDSAGSNDLTPGNTPGSATGIQGDAVDFSGSQNLSINDNASMSTGNIDFTVAAWVKFDTVGIQYIANKWTVANQLEFNLYYDPGPDFFVFALSPDGTGGSAHFHTATTFKANVGSPTTGQWYFVVGWHDSVNNRIGISVNGHTNDAAYNAAGVFDSTSPFQLGIGSVAQDAKIDEVGFWKKVLSTDERARLYNSGLGKTCLDPCTGSFDAPVGYPTGGSDIGSREKYFKDVFAARYYGKSFNINNFDVAEEYEVDDMSIEAGDVVRFKPDGAKLKVEKAGGKDRTYDKEVVGVISTEPGLYLKDWEANKANGRPVALVGRVPVKVSTENGAIKRGDYLTASSTPGVAMKASEGGYIIGRAMEDLVGVRADSTLVKEELQIQKDGATKVITQMVDDRVASEMEAQEMNTVVEEAVDNTSSFGRIMMYMDLGYVDDGAYGEKAVVEQALTIDNFALSSGENILKLTETTTNYNLTFNMDAIVVAGGLEVEGDLKVGGELVAKKIEIKEIKISENIDLPKKNGTIDAGIKEIAIKDSNVKENSLIYLATSEFVRYRVKQINAGQSFVIEVESPPEKDIKFEYLIL